MYADQDLRLHGRVASGQGQGSECITGHIEHRQNGNRIMSGTITCPRKLEVRYKIDEIVFTETRVWKLDHARGGAVRWGQRKQPYGQRL